MFDDQFNEVLTNDGRNSGFEQVGAENEFKTHTKSGVELTKNGYLYVYVSNESTDINVLFDNLQVTHIRGPLLEENHYYPFGLIMTGISSKALNFGNPDNKIKFQKQELQNNEFSNGSGLEMYQFKYRMYDLQIGRFWQIDPLADKYDYNSPYAFSENKVTTHVELEGLEAFFIHGTTSSSKRWKENPNTIPTLLKLTNNKYYNSGFNWKAPLLNNEKSRGKTSEQLANYVLNHRVDGEEMTLVGHSHGGNVAIQASKLIYDKTGEKVNLITIETPAYNKASDKENPETQKLYINDHIALWNKRDVVAGGWAGDHNYTNSTITKNVEVNVDKNYVGQGYEVNAGHGETITRYPVNGYGAHSFDVEHPEAINTLTIEKLKPIQP